MKRSRVVMIRSAVLMTAIALVACAVPAFPAQRVFQSTGFWGDVTKWLGGIKPAAGDDVVINANCTVNENIGILTFGDITVSAGFHLYLKQYTLSFSGSPYNDGFIHVESTASLPLPANKAWGNYVYFEGTSAQTVPAGSYTSLKISATGTARTVATGGDITVTHELNVEGFTSSNQSTLEMGTYRMMGQPTSTYVSGILRTASTSGTPLPSGMRWYSINLGKQGRIDFYSASNQSIPGGTYDDDILITGGSDKTLTGVMYVNAFLTLNGSRVVIVDSDLVVGPNGVLQTVAMFSANNMFIIDGAGGLTKSWNVPFASFLFPVGEMTGTREYSPLTMTMSAVSAIPGSARVRVVNAKHPGNASLTNYLTRYWTMDITSSLPIAYGVTCTYLDADIVGDETRMYTGMFSSPNWYRCNAASASANQISATGVWQSGAFTGMTYPTDWQSTLTLKAMLQGSFDTTAGTMRNTLRQSSRVPVTQPYGVSPWNYTGVESCSPLPDSLVDWVLLELRPTPAAAPVARRAALLMKNGIILDVDGVSPVGMPGASGLYYIVVRHRNHLAVMSTSLQGVSQFTPLYDFTTAITQCYGAGGMIGLTGGGPPYGLWAGDADANGQLKYTGTGNDPVAILTRLGGSDLTATLSGYYREDTNMDGAVVYSGVGNDRAIILINLGGFDVTYTMLSQAP
jgi:hypothetical protein